LPGGERGQGRERESFIDNLLVRIHCIIVMIGGPASRHGSLNSLFGQGGYQPTPGRQFRARIPCRRPRTREHRFRESQPRRVSLHRECRGLSGAIAASELRVPARLLSAEPCSSQCTARPLRAASGLGETQPTGLRSLEGIGAGGEAGRGGRQGPASPRERWADANRRRRQPISRPASAPRHQNVLSFCPSPATPSFRSASVC